MIGTNGKAVLTWIIVISCLATLIFIVQNTDTSSKALNIPKIAHYSVANIKPLQQKELYYVKDIKKPCGYTNLFPGGYGAKIHDMMFAWSWSLQHNVSYEGAIGSTGQTKTLIELLRLLKLPFRIQSHPFKNCRLLSSSNYKSDHWIFMNPFFKQRSNAINVKTNRTVVVHVRRGDVSMNYPQTGDYYRYIPNSYFLDLLENIRKPNDHVIILSQRTESFADFVNAGYDVQLDTSVVQAWKTMIESDIFIMSRSSFSYIPALFAKGAIYYDEFWNKPLAHWLTNTTLLRQVDRPIKISMKEITIPCEGGVFGAQTTQMHACIISKQTTPRFTDIPDIAQTVYPCWSWFGEKQAKNCVFVVKDRLSHKWFNFISGIMGCLVISKQPRKCTILGMLNSTNLHVEPGHPFTWLSSTADAIRLQHNAFRQDVKRKYIGIINRKTNLRIRNIDKMNITNDIVDFEDLPYLNKSKWMHEHDIIIGAHSAAMIHSIFIKKCTVVIQLYPEHYYPNQYFESLIRESGGIPISWIRNKYLGNNATLAAKNEAMLLDDFKSHKDKSEHWKFQDINIDKNTINKLLQIASEEQLRCRIKK